MRSSQRLTFSVNWLDHLASNVHGFTCQATLVELHHHGFEVLGDIAQGAYEQGWDKSPAPEIAYRRRVSVCQFQIKGISSIETAHLLGNQSGKLDAPIIPERRADRLKPYGQTLSG